MGAGIAMAPGDIAFKSNFATLEPATGIVLRRRADRRFEELGPQLCAALDGAPPSTDLSASCHAASWGVSTGYAKPVLRLVVLLLLMVSAPV